MLWNGETWTCVCRTTNAIIRKRCRCCGATELEARIAIKSREIAATGLCQWQLVSNP